MLERVVDAPAEALALSASGTVMARDVEAAIEAAVGPSSAATGLVIVIDPDFDGYLAELARGLGSAALAHKPLVKLAVVCDAGLLNEAKLSGFDVSRAQADAMILDARVRAGWIEAPAPQDAPQSEEGEGA